MLDPSVQLHAAIVAALKAVGALPDVVGARVYDDPPTVPTFPYVTLGDCQVLPDKAACYDGTECYPIIDVWSRNPGYGEAKAIAAAVIAKLDDQTANIAMDGFAAVVFERHDYRTLRDPDGLTRRVNMTFRALIQPTT
jgi:hypothetical protein